MGMGTCSAKISNVFWSIKVAPTMWDIERKARKVQKDPQYFTKLEEKKAKKDAEAAEKKAAKMSKQEAAEELKKARKFANEESDDTMSEEVANDITEICDTDALKKVKMTARAVETNKLIQYAFYYMTCQDAKLVTNFNQIEKEIINGIAAQVNFGKIYSDDGIADLKKYDFRCKDDWMATSKYILSLEDIRKRALGSFQEQAQERLKQLAIKAKEENATGDDSTSSTDESKRWKKDENGIIHPIFFTGEEDDTDTSFFDDEPVVGPAIAPELFEKLESDFDDMLPMKHRYQMLPNNLVQLYVTRDNGIEEFYTLDPGIVMGLGKTCILGNLGNDTLFVPVDNKEICKNILSSAFYVLTQDECQTVIKSYFRNMSIYRYLDMSKTDKLAELNDEDFQKLGKKITFILNQLAKQNQNANQDLPRFRFVDWKSVDDFMIISDPTVVSPLASTGETSPVICEGLIFEVHGDTVVQRMFGSSCEHHIDKYGDM